MNSVSIAKGRQLDRIGSLYNVKRKRVLFYRESDGSYRRRLLESLNIRASIQRSVVSYE